MKRTLSFTCMLVIGLAATSSRDGQANEGSWLHRAPIVTFCVAGLCHSIHHTWAESASADSGCQNDEVQSFPDGVCLSSSASGCAWMRRSWDVQWYGSRSCNRGLLQTCYSRSPPGTYAYNGVCHQGTNRALAQTPVPFVHNLDIGGGTLSYGIFHTYGSTWPWGFWYGTPC